MGPRSSGSGSWLLVTLTAVAGCGGNDKPPPSWPAATPIAGYGTTPAPTVAPTPTAAPAPSVTAADPPPPPHNDPKPKPTAEEDGEWVPGKSMGQALARVAAKAKMAESVGNYGFDKEHACFLGAFLRKGRSVDMTQEFMGGVKYAILGGGSASAIDVDLGLFDMAGKSVALDVDNDPSPIIEFTPPVSGKYKFVLKLQDASTAGSFVAVALMRQGQGAWTIPPEKLVQSFGSLLQNAKILSEHAKKQGTGELFFHENGDWSFYGGVLTPGWSNIFRNLHLDAQPTVVLGGGDNSALDVDLQVTDETDSKMIAQDTDNDATPMAAFRPEKGHSFSLKVINSKSNGPSLVTATVLDSSK